MILTRLMSAALIGFGSYGTSPSLAGESEQAALCRGDVMRLCMSEIPDRDRIVTCMKAKVTSLSPGCKAVFVSGPAERRPQRTAKLP